MHWIKEFLQIVTNVSHLFQDSRIGGRERAQNYLSTTTHPPCQSCYRAGIARNQISIPNSNRAAMREKTVCRG